MAVNDNEFINPSIPLPGIWRPYTYLDPWESTTQAFYEFKFIQPLQFRNYKIKCYSIINGRTGRLVGNGNYVRGTRSYFVTVNGRDYTSEDYIGENSLFGYPTGFSQYDGVSIMFLMEDISGNVYKLN